MNREDRTVTGPGTPVPELSRARLPRREGEVEEEEEEGATAGRGPVVRAGRRGVGPTSLSLRRWPGLRGG